MEKQANDTVKLNGQIKQDKKKEYFHRNNESRCGTETVMKKHL